MGALVTAAVSGAFNLLNTYLSGKSDARDAHSCLAVLGAHIDWMRDRIHALESDNAILRTAQAEHAQTIKDLNATNEKLKDEMNRAALLQKQELEQLHLQTQELKLRQDIQAKYERDERFGFRRSVKTGTPFCPACMAKLPPYEQPLLAPHPHAAHLVCPVCKSRFNNPDAAAPEPPKDGWLGYC